MTSTAVGVTSWSVAVWFWIIADGTPGAGVITVGRVSRGASEFHTSRASNAALVSKYCGLSPAPGTLCARVPAGIEPWKPLLTVNASFTLAATPGRSR